MFINSQLNYKHLYKTIILLKNDIFITTNSHNFINNIKLNLFKNECLIDQTAIDFIIKDVVIYIFNNNHNKKFIEIIPNKGIIDSIQPLIKSAVVTEREIFELFGIFFNNALTLRRLLTDYSLIGNPLKKIFPLTGFFEVHYSTYKTIIYQKINFLQEIRNFDKFTLWKTKNDN